jgi:peptide/nickel transport system substrate-binding protein
MESMVVRPLTFLVLVALTACAPPSRGTDQTGSVPAQDRTVASNRPLNMAVRYEVNDLAPKRTGGAASTYTKRSFNASLAIIDDQAVAQPYLAETLPRLNTESWKVEPDGRMETTYRLRPNLTWHDGTPFSAEDFVFAYQVYTARGLGGTFTSSPQDQMDEVSAPDARTLVIRWKQLYPQAGALVWLLFEPLPKHILEAPFRTYQADPATPDAFLALPFWTTEYVGLGPYRVDKWLPGSAVEGSAFAGHALGRPKVERIVIHFIPDENTVMTNLLAGAIDLAGDTSIRFEQAAVLKKQWDPNQGGTILMQPGTRHWIFMQFRPEFLKTTSLLDVRVRRAIAHAIDREPINEALFEGQGFMSDFFIPPMAPYAADVDRAVAHYPFDPRRAAQLLTEAGFTRDTSGAFLDPNGVRFRPNMRVDGSPTFVREIEIMQSTWSGIGMDLESAPLPGNVGNLNENRTTFPDMYASSTGISENQLDIFSSAQLATAAKRWAGNNRGGWDSPEYERWWNAFNTTLDRTERNQQIVEMMKVVSDQLPGIMLYFNISPEAHVAALKKGPTLQTPETLANWNMHEWEWR